jgi:curli production assembly/transport component CsgE
MRWTIKILTGAAWMLLVPIALSAPAPVNGSPTQSSAQTEEDLMDGLVTNRTVTVLGWDFYQTFTAIWEAKYTKERVALAIFERPTARWGSEIWIQFGQTRVFHTFLPPARSRTEEVSKLAVEAVHENITRIKVERALYSDIDLAPEEM